MARGEDIPGIMVWMSSRRLGARDNSRGVEIEHRPKTMHKAKSMTRSDHLSWSEQKD